MLYQPCTSEVNILSFFKSPDFKNIEVRDCGVLITGQLFKDVTIGLRPDIYYGNYTEELNRWMLTFPHEGKCYNYRCYPSNIGTNGGDMSSIVIDDITPFCVSDNKNFTFHSPAWKCSFEEYVRLINMLRLNDYNKPHSLTEIAEDMTTYDGGSNIGVSTDINAIHYYTNSGRDITYLNNALYTNNMVMSKDLSINISSLLGRAPMALEHPVIEMADYLIRYNHIEADKIANKVTINDIHHVSMLLQVGPTMSMNCCV